jgi:TolB-like protein
MKAIIALLAAFFVAACSTGPTYQAAETSEFTNANYSAVDKLVSSASTPIDRNVSMLVATLVNIDAMNQSSRFGRLVSEQVATRLTQRGFSVVEMKLRSNVYIREGAGELMLSRDVRDLTTSHNAQIVVVGNYAVAAAYIYVTLKAVTVADNKVISAINYLLPLTGNNAELLSNSTK